MTSFGLTYVDAHVHFWDPERFPIAWVHGDNVLNTGYGPREYEAETTGLPIEGLVFVQADVEPSYALLEVQWVAGLAEKAPRIQAIVGWAPLEYGDRAGTYVDALVRTTPLLRGVRRILQSEPDPAFCTRPEFVRGVQLLAKYDLSFDICILHHQLPAAIELVGRCSDVRFVLDHLGKPGIRAGLLDPWREQLQELASLPNVACKISGLVTEADPQSWTVEHLAPYVMHALEVFGEDRVLFGGDWPVVRKASTYQRWVDTLNALTAELSVGAKRKLWSDNARRIYRLTEAPLAVGGQSSLLRLGGSSS